MARRPDAGSTAGAPKRQREWTQRSAAAAFSRDSFVGAKSPSSAASPSVANPRHRASQGPGITRHLTMHSSLTNPVPSGARSTRCSNVAFVRSSSQRLR